MPARRTRSPRRARAARRGSARGSTGSRAPARRSPQEPAACAGGPQPRRSAVARASPRVEQRDSRRLLAVDELLQQPGARERPLAELARAPARARPSRAAAGGRARTRGRRTPRRSQPQRRAMHRGRPACRQARVTAVALQGKRIFITGGAGFIATTLARQLVDANEVVALDNLHRDALSAPISPSIRTSRCTRPTSSTRRWSRARGRRDAHRPLRRDRRRRHRAREPGAHDARQHDRHLQRARGGGRDRGHARAAHRLLDERGLRHACVQRARGPGVDDRLGRRGPLDVRRLEARGRASRARLPRRARASRP